MIRMVVTLMPPARTPWDLTAVLAIHPFAETEKLANTLVSHEIRTDQPRSQAFSQGTFRGERLGVRLMDYLKHPFRERCFEMVAETIVCLTI